MKSVRDFLTWFPFSILDSFSKLFLRSYPEDASVLRGKFLILIVLTSFLARCSDKKYITYNVN